MELPTRMSERFTLADLIGRGTCSSVFRARDELLDRDVAVKIFPVTDDPRVAREVHLLASLDHPALVPVYDLGEVDGRAYVVMALFEGGNLADRLAADGPLSLGPALLAAAAVADALAHVHRAGVLHRDVIPRNVLFDADDRAHLSDFGVALVADAPRITDTGIVVGSAPYLAPEQVRGEAVGPAADVYSLGLVTIEALTGRPAYEGTPLEAAQARLERAPTIPAGLPDEVAELIANMTADDPGARPDAETVCRRMRQVALAQELAAGDPRVDPPVTRLTPVVSGRAGPGRRAGRGTLVLGAATLSIMLASSVVIASTGPVGSLAATTPPEAGLAAPTLSAPAPLAPFAVGIDDEPASDEPSGDAGSVETAESPETRSSETRSSESSAPSGGRNRVVAAAPRTAPATEEADPDAEPVQLAVPPRQSAPDPDTGPASEPDPEPAEPTTTTSSTAGTSPRSTTTSPRPTTSSSRSEEVRDREPERSTTTTTTTTTSRSDDEDEDESGRDGRSPRRAGLLEALGDPVSGILGE